MNVPIYSSVPVAKDWSVEVTNIGDEESPVKDTDTVPAWALPTIKVMIRRVNEAFRFFMFFSFIYTSYLYCMVLVL